MFPVGNDVELTPVVAPGGGHRMSVSRLSWPSNGVARHHGRVAHGRTWTIVLTLKVF